MSASSSRAQRVRQDDANWADDTALQEFLAEPIAAMRKLLLVSRPACTSSALSLLRANFPDASLHERLEACEAYAQRLE